MSKEELLEEIDNIIYSAGELLSKMYDEEGTFLYNNMNEAIDTSDLKTLILAIKEDINTNK